MTLIELALATGIATISFAAIAALLLQIAEAQKLATQVENNLAIKEEVTYIVRQNNHAYCDDIVRNVTVNTSDLSNVQFISPIPSYGSPSVSLGSIYKGNLKVNRVGIKLSQKISAELFTAYLFIEPSDANNNKIALLRSHEIPLVLKLSGNLIIECYKDTDVKKNGVSCPKGMVMTGFDISGQANCTSPINIMANPVQLTCGLGCTGSGCKATDGGRCQGDHCVTNGHYCNGPSCRAKGTHPCIYKASNYPNAAPSILNSVSPKYLDCQGAGCCIGPTAGTCPNPASVP